MKCRIAISHKNLEHFVFLHYFIVCNGNFLLTKFNVPIPLKKQSLSKLSGKRNLRVSTTFKPDFLESVSFHTHGRDTALHEYKAEGYEYVLYINKYKIMEI